VYNIILYRYSTVHTLFAFLSIYYYYIPTKTSVKPLRYIKVPIICIRWSVRRVAVYCYFFFFKFFKVIMLFAVCVVPRKKDTDESNIYIFIVILMKFIPNIILPGIYDVVVVYNSYCFIVILMKFIPNIILPGIYDVVVVYNSYCFSAIIY